MLRRLLLIAAVVVAPLLALADQGSHLELFNGFPAPTLDFDFVNGTYRQDAVGYGTTASNFITVSRASSGTDLLPTSASGYSYSTFSNNVARITSGLGLLVEEARTNQLLNSTAPATQTTGSLANATYTLWVNGSGSATMSAGTATGCGTGVATQGSPVNFTTTGAAGTCTVTVAGSLNAFQLEAGAAGTSLIVTAGATAARAVDAVTVTTLPAFNTSATAFANGSPSNAATSGAVNVISQLDDGTSNNRIILRRVNTSGNYGTAVVVGGSTVHTTDFGIVWAANTAGKIDVATTSGATNSSANGGLGTFTGTTYTGPTITTIRLGKDTGTTNVWNGYIHEFKAWTSWPVLQNIRLLTQ